MPSILVFFHLYFLMLLFETPVHIILVYIVVLVLDGVGHSGLFLAWLTRSSECLLMPNLN